MSIMDLRSMGHIIGAHMIYIRFKLILLFHYNAGPLMKGCLDPYNCKYILSPTGWESVFIPYVKLDGSHTHDCICNKCKIIKKINK